MGLLDKFKKRLNEGGVEKALGLFDELSPRERNKLLNEMLDELRKSKEELEEVRMEFEKRRRNR